MKNNRIGIPSTTLLVVIFSLFIPTAFTQIPTGYYDSAAGKTGTELQAALHNIIKGHTSVAYSALYAHFKTTDVKPENVVWDMYSDVPGGTPPYIYHYTSGDECGNYSGEGDCYNREHSWPNSWFGGEVYPMYSDMFHLYPTDGYVNNRRGNNPYGEVANATWTSQNGSRLGSSAVAGYSGTVFEPIDAYKGDFARSYFYMSTRYYTEDAGWPGSPQTTGSQLQPWAQALLLSWNSEDPVSEKEINRNNLIYGIQHNRNPYIDHPEYANLIWGYPVGQNTQFITSGKLLTYPNPATDVCTINLPDGLLESPIQVHCTAAYGGEVTPAYTLNERGVVLQVKELPAGIYLVTITSSRGFLHGKFVKNQ